MSMVIGNSKGRVLSTFSDKAGWWVSITLNWSQLPPLTLISTYQVVDVDPTKVGDSTYANQLAGFYSSQNREDPHCLRKHHSADLLTYMKTPQTTGRSIILAGDFNESLGDDPAGISWIVVECNLIDPISDRHGSPQFTTYQRGQKVLDYMLVTPDLLASTIRNCGFEPFQANIFSNHWGVYIDFSMGHLFGKKIHPLHPPALRDISSKKVHQIVPYWNEKYKYLLLNHHWYDAIKDIQRAINTNEPCDDLAESLYTMLCEASISAGATLRRHPPAPYSDEINRLRIIVRLHRLILSQMRTGYDLGDSISLMKTKLGSVAVKIPNTLTEAMTAHNSYNKELRATIKVEENNRNLRKMHLDKLADAYEPHGDKKQAAIVRWIKRA